MKMYVPGLLIGSLVFSFSSLFESGDDVLKTVKSSEFGRFFEIFFGIHMTSVIFLKSKLDCGAGNITEFKFIIYWDAYISNYIDFKFF